MKNTEIYEILRDYTAGKEGLEETNAALREAGAGFHLTPGRNVLSDAERRETVVGYYPEQASGWGLLDTGTGTVDKVHVAGGRLDHAVNEVWEDGSCSMMAYVHICGRVYAVRGDVLAPAGDAGEEGDDLHKSAGPTGAVR